MVQEAYRYKCEPVKCRQNSPVLFELSPCYQEKSADDLTLLDIKA